MAGLITLSRTPVNTAKTDIIGYAAKDTGEMAGGVARDILLAAGEDLLDMLKQELSKSGRQVGDVIVTESLNLKARGIRWIFHIISITRSTSRCPWPARIADGVTGALSHARVLGARSISLAALGSGEGQVAPSENARLMMGAAKDFLAKNRDYLLDIDFALPDYRDYDAFERLRQGRS